MMIKRWLLTIFCVLPFAILAADGGLHCKQVYIDIGASRTDVYDACGEPMDRDKEDGRWTYKDRKDEDYKILVFGKDTVVDIISEEPDSVLDDIVSPPVP